MDFRAILEGKIAAAEGKTPARETHVATMDPAHLAFLLGKIEVRRFRPAPKPAPIKASRPKPQRPAGPPHVLNERQKAAAAWFSEQGEVLRPDFNAHELKSAFRRLALRLHPDVVGGSDSQFIALRHEHAALKSLAA